MIQIQCNAVLLDIEGTVSPVAFVYDVMFPFVRDHVATYLHTNWHDPGVREAVALVGHDVGQPDVEKWLGDFDDAVQQRVVVSAVHDLMGRDAKVTGLKQMQGLVWRDGFASGQLVSELFPDVLPAMRAWKSEGLNLFIYSSGSIGAQKLFFGHTTEGNLLDLFSGHFDTTSGNKKEVKSYDTIGGEIGLAPGDICFVSDIVAELDAARLSGMQTVLRTVSRQSANSDADNGHIVIHQFDELQISNGKS